MEEQVIPPPKYPHLVLARGLWGTWGFLPSIRTNRPPWTSGQLSSKEFPAISVFDSHDAIENGIINLARCLEESMPCGLLKAVDKKEGSFTIRAFGDTDNKPNVIEDWYNRWDGYWESLLYPIASLDVDHELSIKRVVLGNKPEQFRALFADPRMTFIADFILARKYEENGVDGVAIPTTDTLADVMHFYMDHEEEMDCLLDYLDEYPTTPYSRSLLNSAIDAWHGR